MSKLTSRDLIHHFANQTKDKERSGDYSYEGRELCFNSRTIAHILDLKRKIVLIDRTFSRKSAFGNGNNWDIIKHSFSSEWLILYSDRISSVPDTLTKEDYLKYVLSTIKNEVVNQIEIYIKQRNLITTNCYSQYCSVDRSSNLQTSLDYFSKKLKLSKRAILNHVYTERFNCIVQQHGWSSRDAQWDSLDNTKPIKYWLDPTKWFTPKQREVLEFKKWKQHWMSKDKDINDINKTYREIYDDPVLKSEFESSITNRVLSRQATRQADAKAKQERNQLEAQARLDSWLAGSTTYNNFWNIPIHLRISPTNPNEVQTTKGVTIPLSHCKLLYRKFRQCVDTNTPWFTNGHTIPIGVYKVGRIACIAGTWSIAAGCHILYEPQIESFIENNNLTHWRK